MLKMCAFIRDVATEKKWAGKKFEYQTIFIVYSSKGQQIMYKSVQEKKNNETTQMLIQLQPLRTPDYTRDR